MCFIKCFAVIRDETQHTQEYYLGDFRGVGKKGTEPFDYDNRKETNNHKSWKGLHGNALSKPSKTAIFQGPDTLVGKDRAHAIAHFPSISSSLLPTQEKMTK